MSPTATETGMLSPSRVLKPGPTARTSPSLDLPILDSGRRIPPAVYKNAFFSKKKDLLHLRRGITLVWGVILLIKTRSARGTNLFNYTNVTIRIKESSTNNSISCSITKTTYHFSFQRRYTANYICACKLNHSSSQDGGGVRWSVFFSRTQNDDVDPSSRHATSAACKPANETSPS